MHPKYNMVKMDSGHRRKHTHRRLAVLVCLALFFGYSLYDLAASSGYAVRDVLFVAVVITSYP